MNARKSAPTLENGSVNWAAMGIEWETGEVNKGGITYLGAELPRIAGGKIDLVREYVSDDAIIGALDGNGWRVPAQDVCRTYLAERKLGKSPTEKKIEPEVLRNRVWSRLMGLRAVSRQTVTVVQTVTVMLPVLPDGTIYEGNDSVEFDQLRIESLVEMGVPADVAIGKVEGMLKLESYRK